MLAKCKQEPEGSKLPVSLNSERVHITDLPPELITTIAAYCPLSAQKSLACVSRSMNQLVTPVIIKTKLIEACKLGDIEMVRKLRAKENGLSLNFTDNKGNTPLSAAVYSTNVPLVDYIVEAIQKLEPSYIPDYQRIAEVNQSNFGSKFWQYPNSNIDNTTWRQLSNWFRLLDVVGASFCRACYKSTWTRSFAGDAAKASEEASWVRRRIYPYVYEPDGRRVLHQRRHDFSEITDVPPTHSVSKGLKELDKLCKSNADELNNRINHLASVRSFRK